MGMNMTEKILAQHAGLESVVPGQLITCKLDMVLANDVTAPPAIKEFAKIGRPVFDNTKIDVSKICRKWYEEKNEFNFDKLVYQNECRHFTQMIWKDSIYVGFGLSRSNTGQYYFVAYYFPAGNIFDKFKTNFSEEKKSHNK